MLFDRRTNSKMGLTRATAKLLRNMSGRNRRAKGGMYAGLCGWLSQCGWSMTIRPIAGFAASRNIKQRAKVPSDHDRQSFVGPDACPM